MHTHTQVFDYIVDNESHEFCRWGDLVPSYTGSPHQGIPHDAFVHTVRTEQLLHLLGLLTDAGKPVMLVGENGCGKTAVINERIRTVCSGEVAEVLSLTVYANRYTHIHIHTLILRYTHAHSHVQIPHMEFFLCTYTKNISYYIYLKYAAMKIKTDPGHTRKNPETLKGCPQ